MLSSVKVLVVDDDMINRMLITSYIESQGYQADFAIDGEQALDMVGRTMYDVIFLDLVMPGIDGYQVLSEIKNNSKLRHIPIIVISGEDGEDSALQTVKMGAFDYLPKPVSPLVLETRLKSALAEKRIHDLEQANARRGEAANERGRMLLESVFPKNLIDQIQYGTDIPPRLYPAISFLSVELGGFDAFSIRALPKVAADCLTQVYSAFDQLVEKGQLERVKVAGSRYMVAGSMNVPNPQHAMEMAELALEMKRTLSRMDGELPYTFNLHIGISVGPVSAGLIGGEKLSYEVWGEAVATAKLLEQTAEQGEILVSSSANLRLQSQYVLEERPRIDLPGKGAQKIFSLQKRK